MGKVNYGSLTNTENMFGGAGGLPTIPGSQFLGPAMTVFNAFQGFKSGGIRGALQSIVPFGGNIFGGGGGHKIRLPNFKVDASLLATRGLKFPLTNLSSGSYHRLGPKIAQVQAEIGRGWRMLSKEWSGGGFDGEELTKLQELFRKYNMHSASSPGDAVNRASRLTGLLSEMIRHIDQPKGREARAGGKGGARLPLPRPTFGMPKIPEFQPRGRAVGGLTPLPAVATNVGDVVGRASNPRAARRKTAIPKNPLSAERLRDIRDILT